MLNDLMPLTEIHLDYANSGSNTIILSIWQILKKETAM